MTIVTKAPLAALVAFFLFVPSLAHAQDQRFRVAFTPAIATVSSDAELALAGSFGYRFSEHFWFEGDVTWVDAAAGGFRDRMFDFDGRNGLGALSDMLSYRAGMFGANRPSGGFGGPGFPYLPLLPGFPGGMGPIRVSTDGSTLIGTIGIRYELPVQTERFRPYLAGGLGINNTDQEFRLERTMFTPGIDESVSHTGYAFSAGAGASVRLVSALWADVDAKYFRLSRDRNVMRFGGGVSVRF